MGNMFADALAIIAESGMPTLVRLQLHEPLDDAEFWSFCRQNPELQIEQSADGELLLTAPASSGSSNHNGSLTGQLYVWAKADGTGRWFDSSGGFRLPNGATRSPDASWVLRPRIANLPPGVEDKFMPLCPDFVVELRSPSDRLPIVKAKMDEYIACGARLGWLIDPAQKRVHVYRPGVAVEIFDNPTSISADPELPGFVLDVPELWEPLV